MSHHAIEPLSRVYQQAEKHYGKIYDLFINVYSLYDVAKDVVKLHSHLHYGAKVIGYVGVLDLAFIGPRLGTSIRDICQSKGFYALSNAMLLTASEVSNLIYQGTQLLEICKDFRLLAKNACSWTNHFHHVYTPLQIVELGQCIEQVVAINKLRHEFQANFIGPENVHNAHARLENVKKGCELVSQKHVELQNRLWLSKKCHLKEQADSLLKRLYRPNIDQDRALKDSEEFLRILKTRIQARSALDTAYNVISAASTLLSTITFVGLPTPVTTVLYGVTTIASVALTIIDRLLCDKNPFAPSPDTLKMRLIKSIREALYTTAASVYDVSEQQIAPKASSEVHEPREEARSHLFIPQNIRTR